MIYNIGDKVNYKGHMGIIVDISKRKQMNNKWLVKYFVLNNDIYKDLEYYYVLTSVA